jgi:hypothetical protein
MTTTWIPIADAVFPVSPYTISRLYALVAAGEIKSRHEGRTMHVCLESVFAYKDAVQRKRTATMDTLIAWIKADLDNRCCGGYVRVAQQFNAEHGANVAHSTVRTAQRRIRREMSAPISNTTRYVRFVECAP